MPQPTKLDALREEVRQLTSEIIRLMGRRLALAREIGDVKRKLGLPVDNHNVERDLRDVVIEACKRNGVDEDFGLRILDLLIEEAKKFQKNPSEGPHK